jgi:hypothetical protein
LGILRVAQSSFHSRTRANCELAENIVEILRSFTRRWAPAWLDVRPGTAPTF